jgi:hypothetical protein
MALNKKYMKTLKLFIVTLAIVLTAAAVTPRPANAFVLFGIHFFEKKPTPTPTPVTTPTPTPTVTPTGETQGVSTGDNLPSTGPAESVGALLSVVVAGFVARKYWQVSHQI